MDKVEQILLSNNELRFLSYWPCIHNGVHGNEAMDSRGERNQKKVKKQKSRWLHKKSSLMFLLAPISWRLLSKFLTNCLYLPKICNNFQNLLKAQGSFLFTKIWKLWSHIDFMIWRQQNTSFQFFYCWFWKLDAIESATVAIYFMILSFDMKGKWKYFRYLEERVSLNDFHARCAFLPEQPIFLCNVWM